MLTVKDISFSFGKKVVFEKLGFTVSDGECIVIAGPNGSGKSTALSVIAGALTPSSGQITVNGKLGYVPQGTALLEDSTVLENLRFFASLSGCTVPRELPFNVASYLKMRVSKLSGGMKKQVSIACALMSDPDVLLFDEPTASLDITFRDEMVKLVRQLLQRGRGVVYVGHDPDEFRLLFDKLIIMGKEIRCYTKEELREQIADADTFLQFYKNILKNSL